MEIKSQLSDYSQVHPVVFDVLVVADTERKSHVNQRVAALLHFRTDQIKRIRRHAGNSVPKQKKGRDTVLFEWSCSF